MPFLEIDGLRKEFGDTVAVDGVTFDVEEGEFVTVVGPSGCGKTTTLLNIAGLQTPTAGSIRLRGKDLTDLPAYERDIGVVFQDYALFPHKTVAENIGFGLKMRGESQRTRDAVVGEMLGMINLEGYEEMYPHECSGGEQQRVAVARALAFDPDLMLMDEPLSNLDKKLRQSMRTELKRIQRETGVTTIYVTHNQTEALSMGDTLAVMNDGRLEQYTDPKTAYEKPASAFVASFLGQSTRLDGTLRTNGMGHFVEFPHGGRVSVALRDGFGDGDEVAVFLRSELVTFKCDEPSAENAFQGIVHDVDYQGRDVIYLIDVPTFDRRVLVSGKSSIADNTVLEEGDEVWLTIPPSDVIYTGRPTRTTAETPEGASQ